jgi:hypothetical protein
MKFAIALCLTVISLSGCEQATGRVTRQSLALTQADVPQIDKATQAKAADEVESGVAPAMTALLGACLVTRDQARALSKVQK